MTLNSDIEALEAIAEEAEELLTRLELLEGHQKSELLAGIRQIIAMARYRKAPGRAEGVHPDM
ncbi:hypothetical protein AAY86_18550 [Pseudomonas amygdali pv. tabaci str. ATCC 11528]|uniref:Uncharacterized protein n=2 Tax=Pseudomonas syringae group TaxID=136849 RepID=A0AB37ZIT0_PSESX|nr:MULTISPECIES: hypothetical protein [Pseudomonas]KKY51488.1 hypothetical protein AAY86_18550 [Pseudomonas amygdali pv. tabaci str. ATCC 11528]KPX52352.1 hypothetical protein ALO67_200094 [Pseudomonas amygdali pv. hibisci]MBI6666977.1 hypothetical protein [Pseudomonas syringae]MBI6678659.1 hypothetical protein [Pseudomonas syringae]MBI6834973.1 hypothetical protein [Pseudomonas syringae]